MIVIALNSSSCDVVANVLDCDIVEREFKPLVALLPSLFRLMPL